MKKMILSFLFTLSIAVINAQVDYESQIQTIFNASCTSCHQYGSQNGLNLTTYSGLMTGGNAGSAIVAGDHANSLLWVRVNNGSMPPSGNLSSGQVNLIAQWIDEGALEVPQVEGETPFISEYAEGSSNNKYLEFYNPTDQTIDLSGYAFASAANDVDSPGNYEYWNEFDAGSQIAPGEVFVIAHPSAATQILSQADMTHTYLSNGNDGYCLVEGTESNYTVIDCIGDWNGDPGTGWDVAGVTNATVDHTLLRKPTVTTGNPDWDASSGTDAAGSEWIVLDNEDWSNLGFHTYGTGGENINPIANAGINQTVEIGSQVTIDGSSSVDPDGTIETYSWTQTAGTTVVLSATDQAIITFTAPSTVDSLSFTLTVTDNDGSTGSATIFVKTAEGVSNAVFFSEYGEGSGNNKYLEIFNGTGQDIDLSQYAIAACSNGCADQSSWDYPTDITFESETVLTAGDVYVVADAAADASVILSEQDMTASPLSNGNDVFGLVNAATGEVIDIIGERETTDNSPANGTGGWPVAGVENATLNHTLVRKSSVEQGNTDWAASAGADAGSSEWIVYDQDTWSYLGSHSQALNAPAVAFNSVAPVFITDETEIEFTVSITTPVGSVSSAVVKYGTSGALVNESDLYLEGGDVWAGTIPAQQGNIVVQMRVYATNSEGVEGQSVIEERIIASSTPSSISDLYSSQSSGEIVTLKGVITIGGGGLLYPTQTKAYIQDQSGRGMQLFDYSLMDDIERGDEIEVVGYTGYYNTTYQLKDFEYRELSNGNAVPDPIVVTTSQANSSEYEGTLISVTGNVTVVTAVGDNGTNLTVDDATSIMIWNSTGIDVSSYIVGYIGQFIGVGSQYNGEYQLLVGYQSDITTVVGVDVEAIVADKFDLRPAYPNPFNPVTKLSFSIDVPSGVFLEVYDISGKLVDNIASGFYQSGLHEVEWNASDLASGMYFVHLVKGNERLTQKVMLLK
tara:strand:+ start:2282 stop:5176 length:2895 start_codon:yes stop_codon:yes gene_type:complete